MKAVVLAGGQGTRLLPLTATIPKQLLPVVEVTMLERVLGWLALHGVEEVVLSLGYQPHAFVAAFPNETAAGVLLQYAVEAEPLDTAGAIRFAATTAGLSETFLVVNGDVLTDLDISTLVSFHRRSGAAATIALVAVEDPSRFGVVLTDAEGRVEAFVEKPPAEKAPSNHINAGTYVLEPDVLARIPAERPVSVERETFPALAAEGGLYAMVSAEYWLDTGTPQAYLQANADLLHGRRNCPPAPGARTMAEGVWTLGTPTLLGDVRPATLVAGDAMLEEGSTVSDSVVGVGAVVGRGATVEGSVLLAGSAVGAEAAVRGSIVGRGAQIGCGAVVEETSVIGEDAKVPDGARLSGGRVEAGTSGTAGTV